MLKWFTYTNLVLYMLVGQKLKFNCTVSAYSELFLKSVPATRSNIKQSISYIQVRIVITLNSCFYYWRKGYMVLVLLWVAGKLFFNVLFLSKEFMFFYFFFSIFINIATTRTFWHLFRCRRARVVKVTRIYSLHLLTSLC